MSPWRPCPAPTRPPQRATFRLPVPALLFPVLLMFCITPLATSGGAWAVMFVVPLLALVWVVVTRTRATPVTVTAYGLLGAKSMKWTELAGLEFNDARWAIAVALDGRRVRLPMVRPRDLPRLVAVSGGSLRLGFDVAPDGSIAQDDGPAPDGGSTEASADSADADVPGAGADVDTAMAEPATADAADADPDPGTQRAPDADAAVHSAQPEGAPDSATPPPARDVGEGPGAAHERVNHEDGATASAASVDGPAGRAVS